MGTSTAAWAGARLENRGSRATSGVHTKGCAKRARKASGLDAFLHSYGLGTDEGIALMCLAEALLRVPDAETMDALIEDKIAPSDWGRHLGKSASSLVNASTWALMLTGKAEVLLIEQGLLKTGMHARHQNGNGHHAAPATDRPNASRSGAVGWVKSKR